MDIDHVLRDHLTPAQYAAAVDKASEVWCLACAGSGKSRTLAYRIAHLLAEGESPQGIVAFTFTNKAAASIKHRVSQALEATGLDINLLGTLYIGTIHAYCQRTLCDMDPIYRQYDVLDDNRLCHFLDAHCKELNLAACADWYERLAKIASVWKAANNEMLVDSKVLPFMEIKGEDRKLFRPLLKGMRDLLRQEQCLDYSQMIRLVVDALVKKRTAALGAIGPIRHLMVDEYQDVNTAQEHLIRHLRQHAQTLFVVGDDDQAIYGWRGADVRNIIEFPQRYPDCSTHTLNVNFRSTIPIVRAADAFLASKPAPDLVRVNKNPVAHSNQTPQDCRVLPLFPDREAEAAWVAARIRDLLGTACPGEDRGLTPADFAILMRSTHSSEGNTGALRHTAFTQTLACLGIPFTLHARGNPFACPQVAALHKTFRLILQENPEDELKADVLPSYPQADDIALARVLSHWKHTLESAKYHFQPQDMLSDLLAAFKVADMDLPDAVMQDIGSFSRLLHDYMSVNSQGRYSGVREFLWQAAKQYKHGTSEIVQKPNAVTVSTVHGAKGLEFPCVFLVDTITQRFPWRRSAEEVRVFYTAVTRAERYLYVTGATHQPEGKKRRSLSLYARQLAQHPQVANDLDELPPLAKAPQRPRGEDATLTTSFSVLRHYLQCPWNYRLRHQYGFPPSVRKELFGYGKSVHTCIQRLHQRYPNRPPKPKQVMRVVEETFHLKHASPRAYKRARRKAIKTVQDYVLGFAGDFTRVRRIEAPFTTPASNCTLTGSIDLLLCQDAGRGAEVVDFKTMEENNTKPDRPSLALQVQLYTTAAQQALDQTVQASHVHFLNDSRRVAVPITPEALEAARCNVEWAVQGILCADFPMRPHAIKCGQCNFARLCPQRPQEFKMETEPPPLHLPDDGRQRVHAFSQFEA